MWLESSSVKVVNLVKKSATIPEIEFLLGDCFLAHPVDKKTSCRRVTARARCELKSGKILHKCSTDCT